MAKPPLPLSGEDWTDQYRLRPGFFGVVLEQLVILPNGERRWMKSRYAINITMVK